jgi:hypothetical protein
MLTTIAQTAAHRLRSPADHGLDNVTGTAVIGSPADGPQGAFRPARQQVMNDGRRRPPSLHGNCIGADS